MKIKLSDHQVETAGVTCLDRLHLDLRVELTQHSLEPYLDEEDYVALLRVLVSIEVIMGQLMHPDLYFQWKVDNGVDL
jgi:hypothetical protein|tara:strand:+ start:1487 stop:1720 length:234 start_codon:yes stop_codon:yes gene_type:complete